MRCRESLSSSTISTLKRRIFAVSTGLRVPPERQGNPHFGAGCLGILAGLFWSWVFPINKNLWTSSYVVFTAGFACVVLATCLWIIDVYQVRGWTKPFVIYGVNPLVAFAGSGLMARTIDSLIKVESAGRKVSLHQLSYERFFEPYFPEKFASLLWGLCFVALWLGILALLHRRNIIVKL